MQITRRLLWGASAAALTLARPGLIRAQGTAPIRIGEINSYTTQSAFTLPYRNAMNLAVEEVNAAGGIMGRKVELVMEDSVNPQTASSKAERYIERPLRMKSRVQRGGKSGAYDPAADTATAGVDGAGDEIAKADADSDNVENFIGNNALSCIC